MCHEGELVLKKLSHIHSDPQGKWTPNYEGPFVIKKAFSGGSLIHTAMDGEEFPLPVNFDTAKNIIPGKNMNKETARLTYARTIYVKKGYPDRLRKKKCPCKS